MVHETLDHPDQKEVREFEQLEEELMSEFDPNQIRIDKAKISPHKFEKSDICIKLMDKSIKDVQQSSGIVRNLSKIEQLRVFASHEIKKEIRNFISNRVK